MKTKQFLSWGRNQAGREVALFELEGGRFAIREAVDNCGGLAFQLFETRDEAVAEFAAMAKVIRWAA